MSFRDWELSRLVPKCAPVRLLNLTLRWLALTDLFSTTMAFTFFWSDRRWAAGLYWTMEDLCFILQSANDGFIVALAMLGLTFSPTELASFSSFHRLSSSTEAYRGTTTNNNSSNSLSSIAYKRTFPSHASPESRVGRRRGSAEEDWAQWRLCVMRLVWLCAFVLSIPNLSVLASPAPGSFGRYSHSLPLMPTPVMPCPAPWPTGVTSSSPLLPTFSSSSPPPSSPPCTCEGSLWGSSSPLGQCGSRLEWTRWDPYYPALLLTYLLTRFPIHSLRKIIWNVDPPLYTDNASFGHLFTGSSVSAPSIPSLLLLLIGGRGLEVSFYFVKIGVHFIMNMAYSELVSCCNLRATVASVRRMIDAVEGGSGSGGGDGLHDDDRLLLEERAPILYNGALPARPWAPAHPVSISGGGIENGGLNLGGPGLGPAPFGPRSYHAIHGVPD